MNQTGVLAYEIQKMIEQYVDAVFTWEPWRKFIQNYPDPSAKDVYDSNKKRPMKSAGPHQETTPNRLHKDLPPEMFDADKCTPMRQSWNQNFDQQGYHEISDYGKIEYTYYGDRNIFGRQSEDRQDEN